MRTSQKVALNILISLMLTGAFAVVAYTGLFRILETDFFSRRVQTEQKIRLHEISEAYNSWTDNLYSRFDALARDSNIHSVFSIVQREGEIQYRADLVSSLQDRLIGFKGIRIIDNDGRIQYSTFPGDIGNEQTGETGRRLYINWEQVPGSYDLHPATDTSSPVKQFDANRQQIILELPVQDSGFITRGWMLVYIATNELSDLLINRGLTAGNGRIHIVEDLGLIVDIRPEQVQVVIESIDKLWMNDDAPVDFAVLAEDHGETYWLVSTVTDDGAFIGKIVPGRLFNFSLTVQILMLSTIFISAALLIFLIQNIKTDKTVILRNRIKKLQVSLLRDWLEHHEDRKLRLDDLESRRDEVKRELRSGLGTMRGKNLEDADKLIDEGWTRIIEILSENETDQDNSSSTEIHKESSPPPIDMKQLEDMITRAVAEAKFIIPPEALAGIQAPAPVYSVPPSPGKGINR